MRVLSAMRLDMRVQARNQLYGISIGVGVLCAAALAWLSGPENLAGTVPMALLMFAGGSTLLYVVAMILLEKSDGTLAALSVSPLRPWEYLASKVVTLTGLAALEGVLIGGGAMVWLSRSHEVAWPSAISLVGLIALGVMHVLVGIVLVVRYRQISEVLVPMSVVALLAQIPALGVVGALDQPWVLAIPSAAPTMLIRAGFEPLQAWEWVYSVGLTVATVAGLGWWSLRAFDSHVTRKVG